MVFRRKKGFDGNTLRVPKEVRELSVMLRHKVITTNIQNFGMSVIFIYEFKDKNNLKIGYKKLPALFIYDKKGMGIIEGELHLLNSRIK